MLDHRSVAWFALVASATLLGACKQDASPGAPSVVPTVSAPVAAPSAAPVPPAPVPPGGKDPEEMIKRIQAAVDRKAYVLEEYQSGPGKTVSILFIEELRLRVSAACLKNGKLECAAIDGLKAVVNKAVKVGGGNPAAYYCSPAGGVDIRLTKPAGESSFCRFASDDSLIDDWALIYVPDTVYGTN